MLKPFRLLLAGLVLFLAATTAFAQSGGILVVDMQKVYADSKVGKYVTTQITSLASTDEATLKSRASSLETTAKSLEAQTNGLDANALRSNTTLVSQIQDLYKRQGELAQEAQKKQAELALTRNRALGNINTQVKSILEQIATERSATAVLESGSVLFMPNGSNADITSLVVQRLDQRMTTTSVARQSLPTR